MHSLKKIIAVHICIISLVSGFKNSFAQVQLLPLRYNTVLFNHQPNSTIRTAHALPFVDDFSYAGPEPDAGRWINNGAFINNTFPQNPVSIGVATLDGINGNGIPYDTISFNYNSIDTADTITSVPILLEGLVAGDSLYFSFFYQAGGNGDEPNTESFNLFNYGVPYGDSLVLEFKDETGSWHHIWSHDGDSSKPFKQVMIPIKDTIYFHDDFQFRFWNYATVAGNFDQWHIDYVQLNKNRNAADTLINDVAIQYYPTSLLKNYQSMPWKQFAGYQKKEKAPQHLLTAVNNWPDAGGKNVARQFISSFKNPPSTIFTSGVSSININPLFSVVFQLDSFPIPIITADTITIATKYIIVPPNEIDPHYNDTVNRDQVFSNYMAYDDGSAEAIYRLQGTPASLALAFHVNETDTLRGIEIHFANTDVDISQNLFSLLVWSALNDADTLYRDDFLKPKYATELNGFTFYRFSRPVVVTDTFYIGFQQTSIASDLKTDLGFDVNNVGNQHLYYNLFGAWNQSPFPGAVMMRPVMGHDIPFGVGIHELPAQDAGITCYPNPVSDVLNVSSATAHELKLEVLDYTGKLLSTEKGVQAISVLHLPSGFYFLRATDVVTGKVSIHKFIKS